ncbi:MAG: non-canonical purine NTP pyrophosphatase [Saprospiraceae bacterium]|nr:non-canonical purine NTP pyrophosphatase [Saprospiraceae bacterium]
MTQRVYIVATHNRHKMDEFKKIFPDDVQLLSLDDLSWKDAIPEAGSTLYENSEIKCRTVYQKYRRAVIAEDTGLEVDILDGAPGVYTARFAGPQASSLQNIEKLLTLMKGCQNRTARFRTVISLIENDHLNFLKEFVMDELLSIHQVKQDLGMIRFLYPILILQLLLR